MSDVAKCPFCNQYIDVTIAPENCSKCNSNLKGAILPHEVFQSNTGYASGKALLIAFCLAFVTFVILLILPNDFTSDLYLLILGEFGLIYTIAKLHYKTKE